MRAYADSSFILRLISLEADSAAAMDEYRRLECPPLFFCPLHALEVRNAILQRAFYQRRSGGADQRREIARLRDAALGRLDRLLARHTLLEVSLDFEIAINRALALSAAQAERLGVRAIDLLHVAAALILKTELFLTTDARQEQLAKTEGLKVVSLGLSPG